MNRLFFALWPDELTRTHLANAAALILTGEARPVPRENYHLTLAFVGEVALPKLAVLQQIGRDQRAPACRIKVDAVEYWPEPQVVVAVAREIPPALLALQKRLRHDLALRLASVSRLRPQPPWRAHVSLARKVVQAPVLQAMSPFYWSARSLV